MKDIKEETQGNFEKDLNRSKLVEMEVIKLLENKFGWERIKENNDIRYDVRFNMPNVGVIDVEIKEDLECYSTGNVALEFECNGKPSGINATIANLYVYVIHCSDNVKRYILLSSNRLKEAVKNQKYISIAYAGVNWNKSRVYLFERDYFISIGKVFHTQKTKDVMRHLR